MISRLPLTIANRQLNSNKLLLFLLQTNKSQQIVAAAASCKSYDSNKISANCNRNSIYSNSLNKFQSSSITNTKLSLLEEHKKNINTTSNNNNNNRIHTIPNYITISRIMSVPFINYFVLVNQHELACGLFLLASVTDFLDGYIARNWPNQQSFLGSILDPLADKLLIGSLTVTLTLNHMLPIELMIIILARDLGLILASLAVRYRMIEEPKTLEKFFNVKKYSTVQVEADRISKWNTFFQLSLITLTLPSVLFNYNDSGVLLALQYLTGTTTILSSISYLYKRGSFKLVNKSSSNQATNKK